jgi:methylated-DNA-[protein]-cysteine S-methyltransferase
MTDQHFALFDTRLGLCAVAWSPRGINGTQLPMGGEAKIRTRISQRHPEAREAVPTAEVQAVIDRIIGLLAGEPDDLADIELDLSGVPDFNRGVYAIARSVPPGRTITYGDIAKQLGGVQLSRDVGQALGRNPCPIVVPCHRVLAAGNEPGGFSANGGVVTKLKMLEIEGAPVNHTPSLFD